MTLHTKITQMSLGVVRYRCKLYVVPHLFDLPPWVIIKFLDLESSFERICIFEVCPI